MSASLVGSEMCIRDRPFTTVLALNNPTEAITLRRRDADDLHGLADTVALDQRRIHDLVSENPAAEVRLDKVAS
eukprot:5427721-Alexandrium_andersonii.AAC.1